MDRPASWQPLAIDLEAERPFRIGKSSVDPISREIRYPAGQERLQPQPLKVLIALAHREGDVVTRSELIDSCWGGRIVGEDVINRAISTLRDLAERAQSFSIETVPKAGYRLIASRHDNSPARSSMRWALTVLALIAVAIVAWAAYRWSDAEDPEPPLVAFREITSGEDPGSRNLAAATAETLSHMMIAGSFHGDLAWPATEEDLAKADLILSGDVRRTGGVFVAVMHLRDRRTGTLLFSQHFESPISDPGSLPEQIGAQVSSNLTGALALLVLDRRHSGDPNLTADQLKAITITVSGQDPLGGYEISRRNIEKHPKSLLSQLGLAFDTAFALSSLPEGERPAAVRRARMAADEALRLGPDFGDSYAPRCYLHPPTYTRECEDRLRAGMKADPDAPFVPFFLSSLLFDAGRFEESSQFARIGLAGHPFHPHKLRRVVRTLIMLGEKEEAEQLFAKAIRWWPDHEALHWDRLNAYGLMGDLDSVEQVVGALPPSLLGGAKAEITSMLVAFRAGDRTKLQSICLGPDTGFLTRSLCLTALHRLGERDAALKVADKLFPPAVGASASETEAMWLRAPYNGIEPMLSAPAAAWLRSEPVFLTYVERTGADRYWRADRLPDFCRDQPEPVCATLARRAANRR